MVAQENIQILTGQEERLQVVLVDRHQPDYTAIVVLTVVCGATVVVVTLIFRHLFDRTTMTVTMVMITHGQIANRMVLIKDTLTTTASELAPV